jgi:prolyl-tRNA editing enzyme YbaK/EbsC (Cys-tRNA(Pro) deacylase)
MTVYVQQSIYSLPEIYINAGHRGILVALAPRDLDVVLAGLTQPVDVAIGGAG